MDVAVEISLYPLRDRYREPIRELIERLEADARLRVITGSLSTQIAGEYEVVMERLSRELQRMFEQHGPCACVLKMLGPLTS